MHTSSRRWCAHFHIRYDPIKSYGAIAPRPILACSILLNSPTRPAWRIHLPNPEILHGRTTRPLEQDRHGCAKVPSFDAILILLECAKQERGGSLPRCPPSGWGGTCYCRLACCQRISDAARIQGGSLRLTDDVSDWPWLCPRGKIPRLRSHALPGASPLSTSRCF